MQPLTTVLLKPGEADRIVAGHPWIYHGSVLRLTQPATENILVQSRAYTASDPAFTAVVAKTAV